MLKAKKKIYENGLRVITVPMKDNPTVTVLILVGVGKDYETKDINGISHFLEHMCFKGTEKRPSPRSISLELDKMGCQYNAFTGNEYTGYYAKGDPKNFKKMFDIISDIYLNSIFSENEIEKEKGVIIEELNMYEDMPQSHVQDLFEEVLYGDQPAGWKIVGTKDTVMNMSRKKFIDYKNKHYVADNTLIIVAGRVKSIDVYKEVDKHFVNIKNSKNHKKQKTKLPKKHSNILIKNKQTDQTHLVLGVRSFPLSDNRSVIVSMIGAILSAGMSSRLFVKLREEMGVAYYVRASNDISTDHGSFQISAGVNNSKVEEVLKEIMDECKKLTIEKISEVELDKVKSFLAGNIKMSLESSDDVANFYGGQELLKKETKTLEEKIKEIKDIKPEEIKKIAKLIFKKNSFNLSLIGPYKDTKKIQNLINS